MNKHATRITVIVWVVLSAFVLLAPQTAAAQNFSGNDTSNYTCPALPDYPTTPTVGSDFLCKYSNGNKTLTTNASIKPPTLRVLEYWFLRILYAAWALSGIVFTLILVFLGFKYMTSQGDAGAIADVRKRAVNWMIGLALIFLSYPVLHTLFNVIGISKTDCYDQLNLPGFQFFFASACTSGTTTTP